MSTLTEEINNLGLGNIELLALVTSTSYDVVFYATLNGKKYQSNALTEDGLCDILKIDDFYSNIATLIKNSPEFNENCMNIVTVDTSSSVKWEYAERNCRVYQFKKNWKSTLFSK